MDAKQLMEIIPTRTILVVGDVMLDEYIWGEIRRISPEAPVPVVEIAHQSYAPGGAGNVASNLASLGSNVLLAGVVGADAQALKLSELFSQNSAIFTHLYSSPDRPTTTKTRIMTHGQQILRVDREEHHQISAGAED